MNTNKIYVNDPKRWRQVFNSLMDVEYHNRGKTLHHQLRELKILENEGKLTLYYPERGEL